MGVVMNFTKILFGAGSALIFMAQPASAQSLRDWNIAGGSEMRATASVTIPLGGRKSDQTEPRLDFAMQSYRIGANNAPLWSINSDHQNRALQRQSIVSFTLDRRPKLLLNGRKLATFGPVLQADEEGQDAEEGSGSNTALLVIGGLGVALLGAAVATTADATDAINDLTDPD